MVFQFGIAAGCARRSGVAGGLCCVKAVKHHAALATVGPMSAL
jgi:hypothetical protein